MRLDGAVVRIAPLDLSRVDATLAGTDRQARIATARSPNRSIGQTTYVNQSRFVRHSRQCCGLVLGVGRLRLLALLVLLGAHRQGPGIGPDHAPARDTLRHRHDAEEAQRVGAAPERHQHDDAGVEPGLAGQHEPLGMGPVRRHLAEDQRRPGRVDDGEQGRRREEGNPGARFRDRSCERGPSRRCSHAPGRVAHPITQRVPMAFRSARSSTGRQ